MEADWGSMEDGIPSGDADQMNQAVKKDLTSTEEINRFAISELKENYDMAKRYFLLNAKRNPSYITYNNLAWYYFKCEELNPFWYDLSPLKKSTEYCMKALQLKTSVSSLRLLRDIFYSKKDYGKAKDVQERIFESDHEIEDYFVMGCICIGAKEYQSAEKYLKKAYDFYYSQNNLDYDDVFITYALCLAKIGRYDEANRIGDYLLDAYGGDSICLINILMIYYYTDNFGKIKEKSNFSTQIY
jgi:tetratricopeptide (TPR) repeat protein